jgi:selenocysteine-specific translation elongation factor
MGEQIIAMDEIGFESGFIIASDNCKYQLEQAIKGTSLEKFQFVDENSLRTELIKLHPKPAGNEPLVPIDNYFNVKSVGTVILGLVKSGTIKKYDKLLIEPLGKEVLVKGIQSQDRDLEQTEPGMRVGLNLKGVEAEELRRGYVICKEMKKSSKIEMNIKKSKFFKQEIKPGFQVAVCAGLQVISCIIESIENDSIKLNLISPLAYSENQRAMLIMQGETLPRIIGSGSIKGIK